MGYLQTSYYNTTTYVIPYRSAYPSWGKKLKYPTFKFHHKLRIRFDSGSAGYLCTSVVDRICQICTFWGLLDPDPDPLVRGTDPDQAPDPDPSIIKKIVRKTLIPTVLSLLFDFLSWKMICTTDLRIQIQIWIRIRKSVVRIHWSGTVPKCHGSTTLV